MNHPLTITHDSTGGYTTVYDTTICIGLTKDEVLGTIAAWLYNGTPQFTGVKVADIVKPPDGKIANVAKALYNNAHPTWEGDHRMEFEELSQDNRNHWIDMAKIAHGQFTSAF